MFISFQMNPSDENINRLESSISDEDKEFFKNCLSEIGQNFGGSEFGHSFGESEIGQNVGGDEQPSSLTASSIGSTSCLLPIR